MILDDTEHMGNYFYLGKCKVEHREEPPLPECLLPYNGKINFDATGNIFMDMSVDGKKENSVRN